LGRSWKAKCGGQVHRDIRSQAFGRHQAMALGLNMLARLYSLVWLGKKEYGKVSRWRSQNVVSL
jgi:hypothetical protein